jgi:hypothetical protein
MRIEFNLSADDPAMVPLRQAWRSAGRRHEGRHAALAASARQHYAELAGRAMPGAVREPLSVVPSLADLLDCPHWDAEPEARENLAGALAYFVDPDDLIPDDNARFGYLDDAFVLKLALDESRHEWFAWCDYVDYVAANPDDAGIGRDAWMQRRRERFDAELRRRNAPYVAPAAPLARFGVR